MIIRLVPVLILAALAPAVAGLLRRGRAGRLAAAVTGWYVVSSLVAGLMGVLVSSLLFSIPLTSGSEGGWAQVRQMLATLGSQPGASLPLLAIVVALALGFAGARHDGLFRALSAVQRAIAESGPKLGYVIVPFVFMMGVSIGVRFGARLGVANYLVMTAYTALLCGLWFLFYLLVVLKLGARQPIGRVLRLYYLPTAAFAAGTSSSLVTLPVNLAAVKEYGVRDDIADFVLPFGAVMNLDASALAYVAYAPFVLSHLFGLEISWMLLLAAWPAVVIFTIAAPGLPAGMGTALWSGTLFASMLALEDPTRAEFVATWVALSSGLPDMLRTATNCTGDGFTSIFMNRYFADPGAPQTDGAA